MKLLAILFVVSMLLLTGDAQFTNSTKSLTVSEAIKIAAGLRIGMKQRDADNYLETHGITSRIVDSNGVVLVYSMSVGDNFGWSTSYPLAGGYCLGLQMRPSEVVTNWGNNGILEGVDISNSNSVEIVSNVLTNTDGVK